MKLFLKQLSLVLTLIAGSTFADVFPYSAQTYPEGTVPFRGVNLSGAEFNISDWVKQGHATPVLYDAALFLYKGMNVYRVPVALEYLINPQSYQLDTTTPYFTSVQKVVTDLT